MIGNKFGVLYINLDCREDRRVQVENEFAKYEIVTESGLDSSDIYTNQMIKL